MKPEKEVIRTPLKQFPTKMDFFILIVIVTGFFLMGVLVKQVFQKDQYITVEMIASGGEWWWGTPPPYYWLFSSLVVGAKEIDVLKKPVAEVLELKYQGLDNRKIAWMKVRLKVKKNFRTNTYTFKQETVQVGKTLSIAPNNVSVLGNVIAVEGQSPIWKTEQRVVKVKILAQNKWQADAIEIGDTMKDNDGDVVAEVLEKTTERAEIVTTNWQGEPLLRRDPLKQDVTLTMRIRVQVEDPMIYFNFYQAVQPGGEIEVQLSKIIIKPNIMTVENPDKSPSPVPR